MKDKQIMTSRVISHTHFSMRVAIFTREIITVIISGSAKISSLLHALSVVRKLHTSQILTAQQ